MSLGSGEILIIVVLALLLFGPDKLPELARQTARVIRDIRRTADDVKSQFNLLGEEDDEPRRPLSSVRDRLNADDNEPSSETSLGEKSNEIPNETPTENYTTREMPVREIPTRQRTRKPHSGARNHEEELEEFDAWTDPNADRYGDEIDSDDSYSINDANGNAPPDNDWDSWRTCEENNSAHEYSNAYENDMTAQERALFSTTPSFNTTPSSFASSHDIVGNVADNTTEKPRDALADLELRITPSTSVARSSAPNRVRSEEQSDES